MTNSEISLLNKGLKFCPTPEKPNFLDLEIDIKEFIRKIELTVFFNGKDCEKDECIVSKASQFVPPDNSEPLFHSSLIQLKNIAENLPSLKKRESFSNITKQERQAILSLNNNSNIIIKKADKGSNIVIMDKEYYIGKIIECLSNSSVYEKLDENSDSKVMSKIKKLLKTHKNCLDNNDKEIKYIVDFDFKTANFYGLPKIHKSKILIEKIAQSQNSENYIEIDDIADLSFRFITGGPIAPTSKLSEFLDILLKPFMSNIKSHVRDTTDFLNKLPTSINDNVTILTCDIKDMYNSITLDLGRKAVQYWLSNFPSLLPQRISNNFVIDALDFVLRNSFFEFLDETYCLKKGTVTGTKVAPTYATLVMAYLEIDLYNQVENHFGTEIRNYVELNWLRFLDDGFIIWKKSFGDFKKFIEILNNLDFNIIFTHEASDQGLPYLNVFVYVEGNKIKTDMFYKKTDSHEYLPFNSNHPGHTKRAIPYNLARTICTIVTDQERKYQRLSELKDWLLKSGYPYHLILSSFLKVLMVDQAFLRKDTTKNENENLLVYVETHNPKNPNVFGKIKEIISILSNSSKYKQIFEKVELIKSVRQPKSLGQILQHSKISTVVKLNGSKICYKNNCVTCFYLEESRKISFGPDIFYINFAASCDSKNIIYKITCNGCKKFYIGMTSSLRRRLSHHKFCVFNEPSRNRKIYKHIYNCAKHLEKPFCIVPFYQCKNDTYITRLATESYFIRKFKPLLND